ncbi:MAG: hypothetical protein ACO1OT_19025 [Heyndrickxia sp.]
MKGIPRKYRDYSFRAITNGIIVQGKADLDFGPTKNGVPLGLFTFNFDANEIETKYNNLFVEEFPNYNQFNNFTLENLREIAMPTKWVELDEFRSIFLSKGTPYNTTTF